MKTEFLIKSPQWVFFCLCLFSLSSFCLLTVWQTERRAVRPLNPVRLSQGLSCHENYLKRVVERLAHRLRLFPMRCYEADAPRLGLTGWVEAIEVNVER